VRWQRHQHGIPQHLHSHVSPCYPQSMCWVLTPQAAQWCSRGFAGVSRCADTGHGSFFFQLSRFLHSIESLAGVLRTRLSVFHCLFKTNQTGTLSIWIHIECIWIDTSEVQSWLQDLVKNWQCGLRLRQMLALDLNTLAFSDCLSAEIILKDERRM